MEDSLSLTAGGLCLLRGWKTEEEPKTQRGRRRGLLGQSSRPGGSLEWRLLVAAVVGTGVSDLQELCQRAVAARCRRGGGGGQWEQWREGDCSFGEEQRDRPKPKRPQTARRRGSRNWKPRQKPGAPSLPGHQCCPLYLVHCSPSPVWPFFWAAPHSSGPLATLHSPIHSSRRHIKKCDRALNLCVTASHVPGERTSIVGAALLSPPWGCFPVSPWPQPLLPSPYHTQLHKGQALPHHRAVSTQLLCRSSLSSVLPTTGFF